jgi:hypothetical protein
MSGFCLTFYHWELLDCCWKAPFEANPPGTRAVVIVTECTFETATELETFKEWGISVDSEIRDINVDITTDQSGFGFDRSKLIHQGPVPWSLSRNAPLR